MQHLRLVGVHEDGMHLLLADDDGNRFSLPLDEGVRAAARRDRPRHGRLQVEVPGGLRPKDVQSMIRAGMTAEEVADRAGWSVEKVHRYEGPILAEREHVAGLARQTRLRPRGGSHGAAPTLDARVTERLRSREIDGGSARWDSRRTDKGAWTVLLFFNAGGRQREAAWQFDALARTLSAVDDEARWLSEDEDVQSPGPIPAPHLSAPARPSRVYDLEAEGGITAPTPRRREGETVDLMAAMRERSAQRGRRRRPKSAEVPGLDSAPEEALPLEELAGDHRDQLPPPAHTHPEDDPEVVKTGSVEERIGEEAASRRTRAADRTRPLQQVPGDPTPAEPEDLDDEAVQDTVAEAEATEPVDGTHDGAARDVPEAHVALPVADDNAVGTRGRASEPAIPDEHDDADEQEYADVIEQRAAAPAARPTPKPAPPARKSGRPSVPSWDDIMFGRKTD
ncbi:septation protein SepH [Terrabacter sp. 2RAF25]|uniref:septation protein SepH n=1 Tax=Terrabacter sp. 2RAF25 TaxID=3232998 RepID=UPI003F9DBAF6